MFDINEFMNAPYVDETATVRRGTEEFRIRALNGAERMRFNDLTGQYDRARYALARGLVNGPDSKPIGEENAAKFLERFGALAEAIFCDIFEFTQQKLERETAIWSEVKKKSDAPNRASTNGSSASTGSAD